MNRRQVFMAVLAASVGALFSCPGRVPAQEGGAKVSPTDATMLYLHPATGADSNSGAKDSPLRTLAAGAPREPVHYRVHGSLFTGNKKFTGSGGGPALNFRDIDPSFLELIGTKMSDQPLALEMDQTKRNYLHPVEGSEAARIGAGLFTK